MRNICPCCGNVVKSTDLLVDLSSNIISFGGKKLKVAPRVAEMVSVLAKVSPQYVSSENLAALVWGQMQAKKKSPSIRTHVREIRRVLQPLGYGVQNARGGFYRVARLELIIDGAPGRKQPLLARAA